MGVEEEVRGKMTSFKDGQRYWDAQYAGDKSDFDWYQQYSHLEVLLSTIGSDSQVLVTGAGTSRVGVDLAARGVSTVHCIEQCQAAVDAMQGRHGSSCKWECGNVCAMTYGNDTYDFVFDKACLDAILCQEGGTCLSQKYLAQVARVMKPGGKFICISTGALPTRECYFASSFGNVSCNPIAKPSTNPSEDPNAPKHYVYICDSPSATKYAAH